jgi:predicted FMN-binding regulatory protein PaiB
VVAKRKLSQNRPDETVDEIVEQLEAGSPYADPRLAGRCAARTRRSGPRVVHNSA